MPPCLYLFSILFLFPFLFPFPWLWITDLPPAYLIPYTQLVITRQPSESCWFSLMFPLFFRFFLTTYTPSVRLEDCLFVALPHPFLDGRGLYNEIPLHIYLYV